MIGTSALAQDFFRLKIDLMYHLRAQLRRVLKMVTQIRTSHQADRLAGD